MAKVARFSTIKKEIPESDPLFIEFLEHWTGLKGNAGEDPVVEGFDPNYLRRLKRKALKEGGKSYWESIRKESLRPRLKMRMSKNLFRLEPLAPNPRNRPKNYRF
ncbi:MAG: hypothetical protein QXT73_05675 [Candidatus Methanomethylicaceae archaeon]